jgi:CBS domain-containing protein
MRIHRIPILSEGRVTGIVTTLDVVRAVAEGALAP